MKPSLPVIPPVQREELEAELTRDRFIRSTNKGNNKIFDFSAKEAPALMREVGRLREISFRMAGGGTAVAVAAVAVAGSATAANVETLSAAGRVVGWALRTE